MTRAHRGGVLLFLVIGIAMLVGSSLVVCAEQQTVITFWHSFTEGPRKVALDDAARLFEESHPGVKVEISISPWATSYSKAFAAHEAGDAFPDVIAVLADTAMLLYAAGAVRPVDDLVEAFGGPSAFYGRGLEMMTWKGNVIGIPLYMHDKNLNYRRDLLEQVGEEPPQTWEDWYRVASKLHNPPQMYGQIMPITVLDTFTTPQWVHALFEENYAYMYDENFNVILDQGDNRRLVKESLSFFLLMWENFSKHDTMDLGGVALNEFFTTGRTPMYQESTFEPYFVTTAGVWNPSLLGGARPPRPGIATGRHGGAIDLIPLQVSANTKNPELVYEFVRSIFSEEVYVKFLHAVPGGMIPTLTSVIEGEAFWDNPTIQLHKELVQASIEGLKTSSLIYMPFGINPYGAAIKNEHTMTKLLSFVALGEKTLDEAIDWAAAELRRIFTNVGTF